MRTVRPITPDEVVVKKQNEIPDGIFEAFNELISENFKGFESEFLLDDVVTLACKKIPNVSRVDMYKKGWFNVEDIYRKAGWVVRYEAPAYNETFEAYFVFSEKSNR